MDSHSSAGRIVGRDTELTHLEQTLDALDGGSAACLTVEGEPGIGKTRLLAELGARANARGHVVLSGAASEFESDLPFSVFVDAMDAYVASQELSDHDAWDPDLERELGRVLPSLRRTAEDTGAIADERYRVHRAVRRLLGVIADEQPLVMVLDDLHWSDGASLELIAALVRRQPSAPVLLALGFRPGQAPAQLSAALARAPVSRLALEQLSETQAAELLDGADARLVAAIYSHAGGNPFYLEQLGRAGAGIGLPRAPVERTDIPDGGLPRAVAAAIAAELESLSAQSRAFLEAAAVAGEPFEPDLAAVIAELSEPEGLVALDDLLARDLVRPTDVPRRFGFRHPLVRRGVYESTRGGWRLAAHARAAEALAARGADAAERAHHVEQSASQGDQDAIDLLIEAGHAAAARAPAAAARWFEAALRLLPSADKQQVEVRVALASAQRSLGELDLCRASLLEAAERLPPEAAMRRVELTALCAAVEHWQGRHEDAHRRLARAWEELPDRSTPEAAALQIELAVDGLYENDFEQNFAMGAAALRTARGLKDRGLIAMAASALTLGEAAAARIDAAREHRAEALEQLARMDDAELAHRLETLYYLGWAENYLEHYDEAIEHAERGVAIARATGEGRLLVPLMLLRGYPFEQQGRLAEANEMCETAVEIARLAANPHFLFWALFELAWARYYVGDLDGAIAAGEESVQVGGRRSGGTMPSSGGGAGWTLAVAAFELGEPEKARQMMHEVGGEEMVNWIPAERYFNWENLALAELALGNVDTADSITRNAEEAAAQVDLRLPKVLAARTRAAVQLASGDPVGAARAADESIVAGAAIGATMHVAYSRSMLGRALVAADDRQRAIGVLREAERELDACGCIRVRDETRRELRKLGARAEVRGPAAADDSGVESLTKREMEISELITERMTNKQIAAQLFLSEKTIESHIRNVFHKLGASSRVEVARMIERERRDQHAPAGRA